MYTLRYVYRQTFMSVYIGRHAWEYMFVYMVINTHIRCTYLMYISKYVWMHICVTGLEIGYGIDELVHV